MELIAYIQLFRRWFWLLILGGFLAGGAAFIIRSQQADQYKSTVTVSVGSFIQAPNPDAAEISTGVELAQTYAVIVKTYEVLQAAIENSDFPLEADELSGMVTTSVVPETSLLNITVTSVDPVMAADLANTLAQQLIARSPSNLTAEQQGLIDFNNAEIERLNETLTQIRAEQAAIDAQLANATDPDEITRLRAQRDTLATLINETSANIAQYASNNAQIQQRTNSLTIVERARIPGSPSGSSPLVSIVLGTMVGVALSAGIALLIEYLDDTIRTPAAITQELSLSTLAVISRFGAQGDTYRSRLIMQRDPGSPIAEEYRTLRTNLLFADNPDARTKTFIITSPGPSEGKSVTVSNLAVSMALAGLRVLLVDADLRRPRVHEFFGMSNEIGLSTLLFAAPQETGANVAPGRLPADITGCLQETDIPGLRVITSGFIPTNPTEVLGSVAMEQWYQVFHAAKNVDVVLFDSPPVLVVSDSVALAAAIKAPVVLVIEAGKTRRGAALKARQQFDTLDIPVKGAVLNAVQPKDRTYGYYAGGYDYYTAPGESQADSR